MTESTGPAQRPARWVQRAIPRRERHQCSDARLASTAPSVLSSTSSIEVTRPSQTGLSGAVGYASGIVYTAASELGQIVRPGVTWSALTFGYDAGTRQLASLDETTRRGGTTFTQEALRTYTRNAAGIITKVATTADGQPSDTQCFRCDGLQALTDAWTPASGDCTTGPTATLGGAAAYRAAFTVDPDTGNRVSATSWSGSVATVSSYGYPVAVGSRAHGVSSVTRTTGAGTAVVASYGYDAAGGMTARDGQTLTYDEAGRLATVVAGGSTERSLYTADGALLLRWGGADGASLFLGDTVLRDKAGVKTGIRTYTAAGVTVAERVSGTGGGLFWLSPDPVGTVGLQINVATGAVTRRFMDPFGNTRGAASAWSSLFGYLNAPASSTGLTQLGARAYDSGLGKFVSVDPLLDTGEPRHANAYTYAYHSPVSYSDPTGLLSVGSRMLFDGGGKVTRPWSPPAAKQAPPPAAGNKPPVSTYASGGGGYTGTTSYAAGGCGYSYNPCGAGKVSEQQRTMASLTLHTTLSTIGLVPGAGEIFDGLDVLVCLGENDAGCAALSAAGAVPFLGWGAAAAKYTKLGAKAVEAGTEAARATAKAAPSIKPGSAGGPTAGKPFPQSVKNEVLEENPTTCVYCRMQTDKPQIDHAVPKSRGGDATVENGQTSCGWCNASKGARDFPVNPPPGYRGAWPPEWWGLK